MTRKWIRWFGDRESRTVVTVCDKALEVRCSAAAARALAAWDSPLVVELELAFACFARKEIRFTNLVQGTESESRLVRVSETLALRVTTIVPESCAVNASSAAIPQAPVRNFVPRWLRIDHAKGRWVGEYGW